MVTVRKAWIWETSWGGSSWRSDRFGLEDGTAHGTNPKCKSGGAGDTNRTAKELKVGYKETEAGDFELAAPSAGMLAGFLEFRTRLRCYFIKHTFLNYQKYLYPPTYLSMSYHHPLLFFITLKKIILFVIFHCLFSVSPNRMNTS